MGKQLGLLEKILKSVGPVCLLQVQEDIAVNLLIYRQHIEEKSTFGAASPTHVTLVITPFLCYCQCWSHWVQINLTTLDYSLALLM